MLLGLSTAPARRAVALALLPLALFALLAGRAAAQEPYRLPPKVAVDILDARPTPAAAVSPDGEWLLLMEQASMPAIAELAAPIHRIAGARISPRTNGPARGPRYTGLVLQPTAGGAERRVAGPASAALGNARWSPDGRSFAFTHTADNRIELWVADVASGRGRRITDSPLNATGGAPCRWLPDGARLLCQFVPDGRGAPPVAPAVPVGPVIQENLGRKAPARTYQDLLQDPHDEALFDYYFTAQLALVDLASGARTPIGRPAVFDAAEPAPGGEYILVRRTVRSYSYLVPESDFAKEIELWDLNGEVVRRLASQGLADDVPNRGVRTGPRALGWRPGETATLVWVEALDEGNPRKQVEHRDRLLMLSAPFAGEPREVMRLQDRFSGVRWAEQGIALVSESNRQKRWTRTWIVVAAGRAAPRLLWDRSSEDRFGDPGDPVPRSGSVELSLLRQQGDWIYLAGEGATPAGESPFLDRLNLRTLKTERLWRSEPDRFESVVAILDDGARRVATRRESFTEPPNYFARDLRRHTLTALTAFPDPAPQLAGMQKRLVTYQRADGVPLSGTLYLPPGYQPGVRLPTVVWAYPREYGSAAAAAQAVSSPHRFTTIRGASHLLFLTQGYAVFDGPSMPIVGGDTANNTYIEQLVASARAAVDKVVQLGIADPDRIGVGGHSYGAFMTANLLAHSNLFRAGIARSGAYNRTLTPFGFQNEERTYWEAPEVYGRMSPFNYAHQLDEPVLLTHGMADDNSGTFPIQTERLYAALKGHGATVRFVYLPHEAHGYAGRESVLHAVAEMLAWFDRYVKNAGPRSVSAR